MRHGPRHDIFVFLLACLSVLLHTACPHNAPRTPEVDAARQMRANVAEMIHWHAYDFETDSSRGLETISDKYFKVTLAPGIDTVVVGDFATLSAIISPELKSSVKTGTCSTRPTMRLVGLDLADARTTVCVSSILVSSLFYTSGGKRLDEAYRNLKTLGINPRDMAPEYDADRINRQRTREDWNEYLAGFGPVWNGFIGSLDFILARELARAVKPDGDDASWNATATDAVQRKNGVSNVIVLKEVLDRAAGRYVAEPLGFETEGDLARISSGL